MSIKEHLAMPDGYKQAIVLDETATGRQLAMADKVNKALELRDAGWSWTAIGRNFGHPDHTAIYGLVQRYLKYLPPLPPTSLEEWRNRENARLDKLQSGHWDNAVNGDIEAAEVVLKIMRRRAALNGLDVPVKDEQPAGTVTEVNQLTINIINPNGSLPDGHGRTNEGAGTPIPLRLAGQDREDADTTESPSRPVPCSQQ